MVGRTRKFGKKIEATRKDACWRADLLTVILIFTGLEWLAVRAAGITNPGPRMHSSYAYTVGGGKQRVGVCGLSGNALVQTTIAAKLLGKFFMVIPVLANWPAPGAKKIRAGIAGHVSGDNAAFSRRCWFQWC